MNIQFTTVTWYSKLLAVLFFIGVLPVLTFYLGREYQETITIMSAPELSSTTALQVLPNSTKNPDTLSGQLLLAAQYATYTIDDTAVTLQKGESIVREGQGSIATETETKLFGMPTIADINGDGRPDGLFYLVQLGGGSGSFYYVVAVLSTDKGYIGSNAVYLGDRIAPQNINVRDGQIAVNYADRRPDQAMAETPTVGVSKYVAYRAGALVEVGAR